MDSNTLANATDTSPTSQLPPRASLVSLPQELQDAIVLHLTTDSYKKSKCLMSLSYTCKTMRETCLPLVYEDIKIAAYQINFDKCAFFRLELLLSRSLTSPSSVDLGQYIKRLQLSLIDPYAGVVEQILSRTKNLTKLHCRILVCCDLDEHGPCIDMQSLGHAFRGISQTLTELNLTHYPRWDGKNNARPPSTVASSDLKHLVRLKVLRLPISLMLGWRIKEAPRLKEVLPPSLVHLTLNMESFWPNVYQWVPEQVIDVLKRFVEGGQWRKVTPDLKSITVHENAWGTDPAVWKSSGDTIKRVLNEAGLRYYCSKGWLFTENC
jgi:hypothetical protein